MLAGVTIVDPASDLDRGRRDARGRRVVHPFTVLRGATTVAAGAEIGPHAVAVDASIGEGAIGRPVLLPSPRHGSRGGGEGGHIRGDQELADRRAARRCRTSPTSATPTSARTRTSRAGNVTANFSHEPGRAKGRTTIGRNVRTGVDNTFVAPVTVGDDAWISAGTVITDDVPPGSLAGFPPRQVTKEGWVYERGKRGDGRRLSSPPPGARDRDRARPARARATGSSAGRRSG